MHSALIKRDITLAMRRPGEVLTPIGFFLMIASLFPLAIGPSDEILSLVRPAILWIAVLLAALPSFDKLYHQDYHNGFIDKLILKRMSLWEYAVMRMIGHLLVMGLPLLATLPVIALFFAIDIAVIPLLAVILAIGLIALTLLGSIAASLTLGARQSSVLSAVLILPLAFPILIFGTLASRAVIEGGDYVSHLALLASACLFLVVLSPAATFYALRNAAQER